MDLFLLIKGDVALKVSDLRVDWASEGLVDRDVPVVKACELGEFHGSKRLGVDRFGRGLEFCDVLVRDKFPQSLKIGRSCAADRSGQIELAPLVIVDVALKRCVVLGDGDD